MSIWSTEANTARRHVVQVVFWSGLPLIDLGYQVAAEAAARDLQGLGLDLGTARRAAADPWVWGMLACDAVGFVLWMMVLRDMKVSAAIPMSAASYILIIAAGWIGFHEPVTLAQLLGGGLVLAGVTMLRREA